MVARVFQKDGTGSGSKPPRSGAGAGSGASGRRNSGGKGRKVEAGDTELCPVCGAPHPKQRNTPYCPTHKQVIDALQRQAKKQGGAVQKKVASMGRAADKAEFLTLVRRFESECPSPGNNLPRVAFDWINFFRSESIYLDLHADEDLCGGHCACLSFMCHEPLGPPNPLHSISKASLRTKKIFAMAVQEKEGAILAALFFFFPL